LIRFRPWDAATGDAATPEQIRAAFTVYPLPTRVTYTREIDFDALGRVWTSNSNSPAWQIEDGQPRVLRLDPDPAASAARQRPVASESAAIE
jgi:hypothetical protein